jgi:hypothetical protein
MSRFVFCGICDTNLGVLFERDAEDDAPTLDFLPHDNCWHVSRQQLVEDLEALHSGESSLPVSLKRIAAGARQLSGCRFTSGPPTENDPPSSLRCSGEALKDGRRLRATPAVGYERSAVGSRSSRAREELRGSSIRETTPSAPA